MQTLVLGASGLLGRQVLEELGGVGTYFSRPFPGGIKLNSLRTVFDQVKPSVCVNCVAERTVDTCENNWEVTKKTNIDFVDELAAICTHENIHLVHISTDYVFDGRDPPYKIGDAPNPLQNYGISKLISEIRVRKVPVCTVIRVPVLYGPGPLGDSAVTLIGLKVLDRTRSHTEDATFPRRPVFTPDLVAFIGKVIKDKITGTVHFANPGPPVTKFQIAEIIAGCIHCPMNHISPMNGGMSATRPYDTQLIGYSKPSTPLREGLEICFAKLRHPPIESGDVFIAIDLDGTIVDSDAMHLQCYRAVKPDFEWPDITPELKASKFQELAKCQGLSFMPGAESLIEFINTHKIAHCVVTNTDSRTVALFKRWLPLLNKLENWVVREDYIKPKPDGEPYKLALEKYGKQKKYIVGVENSHIGYQSLRSITECIYIIGPEKVGNDVHRIASLRDLVCKDCT
jgi:dTDP-4-dehydrorhamnose reductase/beta-phosphoglucomutase-like phosphatase (HAD superfamily)